jgi:hypothetical protein
MKKNLALLLAMMLGLSNAAVFAAAAEEATEEVASEGEGAASAQETVMQEVGAPVGGSFKTAQFQKAGELFREAKEAGDMDMMEALIAHFKSAGGRMAMNVANQWQTQLDAMKKAE